jgi:hypothetical protein
MRRIGLVARGNSPRATLSCFNRRRYCCRVSAARVVRFVWVAVAAAPSETLGASSEDASVSAVDA